jgi:hypothetical protein
MDLKVMYFEIIFFTIVHFIKAIMDAGELLSLHALERRFCIWQT